MALYSELNIPDNFAFISKIVALFVGSRRTFGNFYAAYQWGYYVLTLATVGIKTLLFSFLPVQAWGGVLLSAAAFATNASPKLRAALNVFDIPTLLLFAIACAALYSQRKKVELVAPLATFLVYTTVQLTIVL